MSKVEAEFRLRRLDIMAPWYGRALVTLATTAPVGVTTWLLDAFAGQTTDLKISAVASLSFSANIAMAVSNRRKSNAMREQSEELNRLRGRVDMLDAGTVGTPRTGGRGKRT